MSFNASIPIASNNILQSYGQMRANFQAINAAFNNNHIALTADDTISGMHRVLIIRPQTVDPTTSATQVALYQKIVSSVPELFYRPSSNQTPIQLTYPSLLTDGTAKQYTFVAGPFIVYGGFIAGPISQGQVVTLTPGTTLLYVDLLMTNSNVVSGAGSTLAPTITGNTFTINFSTSYGSGAKFDAYYFALGV